MQELMGVMLGALRQDTNRIERIGVNLANALTPAYQREILVASPVQRAGAGGFAQLVRGTDPAAAPDLQVVRDTRPGTLKATGQTWDLALASGGYFEVMTPNGPAYTRRGQFQVDASGRLVTLQGFPVMGVDGDIRPGHDAPRVTPSGQVRAGDRTVGQLKLVQFDDATALRHLDAGYFASDMPGVLVPEQHVAVRQGFLENANVSHTQEMVDLMRTMRHFESMTRVLQGYDDMLGGAIRKLGD